METKVKKRILGKWDKSRKTTVMVCSSCLSFGHLNTISWLERLLPRIATIWDIVDCICSHEETCFERWKLMAKMNVINDLFPRIAQDTRKWPKWMSHKRSTPLVHWELLMLWLKNGQVEVRPVCRNYDDSGRTSSHHFADHATDPVPTDENTLTHRVYTILTWVLLGTWHRTRTIFYILEPRYQNSEYKSSIRDDKTKGLRTPHILTFDLGCLLFTMW